MDKKPQEEAWDSHTIDFVLDVLIEKFGYEKVKERFNKQIISYRSY